MIKGLIWVIFVLADDDICDGLLMMLRDGLGYSSDLGADEHCKFQGHGIIGYFHFCVPDGEVDFRSDQIGVLVDGNLIDGRIVFFLFLFSLLLLFLGSHSLTIYYSSCTKQLEFNSLFPFKGIKTLFL